jgi:hypothetical protein
LYNSRGAAGEAIQELLATHMHDLQFAAYPAWHQSACIEDGSDGGMGSGSHRLCRLTWLKPGKIPRTIFFQGI